MKLKHLLMKTLFVAVGLCVGQSVWAQISYPYNVGSSTDDTWFSHVSPVYSLSTNGIIDITFTNHRLETGDNWNNWLLVCGKSSDTQVLGADDDNRYFIMRSDRWDDLHGTVDYRDANIFVSDDYFTDFATFQNGATVNLRISRVGTLVTVYTTVTKGSASKYMSYAFTGVGADEELKFYLTQNTSWLTIDAEPIITETIISQDYQNGVADWTSGNTGRYTVDMTTDGANKYLAVNSVGNGNSGALITGTTVKDKITSGANFETSSNFTMFFDMKLTGGNNQPSWIVVNDASDPSVNVNADPDVTNRMLILIQESANSTTWGINGSSSQKITLDKNVWYRFQLSKSDALLYLTVINASTGDEVFPQQSITIQSSLGGLGSFMFATKRYYSGLAIDNIVLRNHLSGDTPAGTATSYTIKYRNESAVEIASDVVVNALVGDEVTASAAQMAPITFNTQKYIYKEGNDNITLVADETSNVITLVYREAETYTYKVTSSIGTVLVNSSDFEGETVTVPYPKYELDGTDLKEAAQSGGTAWYAKSYSLTANLDETITYSNAATPIENVVFYIEGENITGATVSTSNNANIRNSNAAVGYAAGTAGEDDLTITTLAPGKYKIVANVHTSSSGAGTSTFILGANNFAAVGNASSHNTEKISDEFTINVNTDLVLQAGGGAQNAVDYVYVIKTGSATVSATLNSAGLASFSSAYPLDLSGISGATAYYAKSDGLSAGKVTLTEATGSVAAGEGLILKGENGAAVTIPVAATGTAISGNLMVGCPTAQNITASTEDYANIYVLGASDAQLHNVKDYVDTNTTLSIPAGKAYLKASIPSGARSLTISFDDDDVTGVNEVRSQKEDVRSEWFDLQGRKVAQPAKGLYIVNGKKVVIK